MNKKMLFFPIAAIILSLMACSFAGLTIAPAATPTPQPTFTPLPTLTPMPTFTPLPTFTPVPTATSIPQIAGIDFPVSVLGVTFKFYAATITEGPVTLGNYTLTSKPGYSTLVVRAYYTGNPHTLFASGGVYQGVDALYITDASGNPKDWVRTFYESDTSIAIGFFVSSNAGPYVLHNTADQPWSVDLSTLFP